MIFPSFKCRRLVDVIMLAGARLEHPRSRCYFQSNDIGVLVIRGDGGACNGGTRQPHVNITICQPDESSQSVKDPDGNEWPKIAIILTIEYFGMALHVVISRLPFN